MPDTVSVKFAWPADNKPLSEDQVIRLRERVTSLVARYPRQEPIWHGLLNHLVQSAGGGVDAGQFERLLRSIDQYEEKDGLTVLPLNDVRSRGMGRHQVGYINKQRLERLVAERSSLGLPQPPRKQSKLMDNSAFAFLVLFVLPSALVVTVLGISSTFSLTRSIATGLVLIVALGASGLICRGIGELRGSSRWKAVGYFLGALAYVATAGVALINGLPRLVQGP